MGMLLTTAAALSCPHGGTVTMVPSTPTITLGGDPIVLATDTFIVAGCPFTLPPAVPHPCVTVQWLSTDVSSTAGGAATLSTDSVGMCVAADQAVQGPVIIQSTQAQVQGT